jgi:hypothetical protein
MAELFPFIFMKLYINFMFVKSPSHDAQGSRLTQVAGVGKRPGYYLSYLLLSV